ncbi:MAG: PqqD family protein [Archangiaceae bacterium]|nr:PqqD family protein [Archangiaceae bacterium]
MAAVNLSSVLAIHPETGAQRVGGRWAAASADGRWHTFEDGEGVSEVGERIMDLVDGQRTVGGIIDVLVAEFDVERSICTEETLAFVTMLVEKQVLEHLV